MSTALIVAFVVLIFSSAFAFQQWIEYRRARALELPSTTYNRTYRPPAPKMVYRDQGGAFAYSALSASSYAFMPGAVWPVHSPSQIISDNSMVEKLAFHGRPVDW